MGTASRPAKVLVRLVLEVVGLRTLVHLIPIGMTQACPNLNDGRPAFRWSAVLCRVMVEGYVCDLILDIRSPAMGLARGTGALHGMRVRPATWACHHADLNGPDTSCTQRGRAEGASRDLQASRQGSDGQPQRPPRTCAA
jgi:hypothetical protein